MASSNQSARDYVKNARQNLVGRLLNLPLIVEKLHQQNVFNANEVSEIEAEPEKYNKTRKILDWVFNKGEEACYKFLRILDRERKSVLPKSDSSGLTTDLRTWICLFFRDEPEDDYIEGPVSCHQLQKILKTKTKQFLGEQWRKSQQFYGGKVQENFTFIPLVLDTDTETNTPHNKIALKRKKSKKSRSKKMRAYIPRDTQRKSPEDLLNSREKSILIVGKPGIGKTTVVQQMLHHWAERHDPNLDFMFYFDENTLSNISTIVGLEHLLLSKVLMSNPQLKDNVEEFLHYLQEYSEKVTIVFDGIKDFQDNLILLEIMKHDLLPEAKVVATCRPEVEYEFSDWTTCKVYVQGFSEESIYDFFRKMSGNDPEIVDSVINNPALFSLCHVPMYAFMVAACISYYTSEEAKKQCTVSELYIRIFRHCLQRHGKKELLHLDGHIIKCKDKILSLAESAFNATKLKTINLDFYYDETGIAGAFLTTVSAVSPAFAETFCAFHHNTMQEFFSALWLLGKTEILEILHQCKNEDSIHMKYVIPFLCGLQSQTNIPLLKCLFPLNNVKGSTHGFFEKVLKTFFCDQPDDEIVDVAFICQCLYEFKSPEACWSFLERINYHLDLSEEHLDPYACCAVSYVISQSRNKQVHLDLENIAVSLSGLKTILEHSQYLRDLSTTLCQVWTISLKQEQLDYLIQLLHLLGNEIHLLMSTETGVLEKAGKIITQSAEQINLYLHCDNDPHQLTPVLCDTVLLWLPRIRSLQFDSKQGEKEREERCRTFLLDLFLQAALHQPHNILQTVEKMITFTEYGDYYYYYDILSDFLLDLYSRVKQYESETGRRVLPALLPVYQSVPAVWSIKLSERKVSLLLEVLKLQTEKKPVVLRDCSDEESEVRSFLQCLPYISHLSFKEFYYIQGEMEQEKRCRTFLLDLCLQAALHQPHNILQTVEKVITFTEYGDYYYYYDILSDFLLDLYSRVKQYESETGRRVLPALLPVYQSGPAVWSINLSERKVSLLLEVLKLQTEKKPVVLRDCSDEESEVRSFLQCLPYISHLSFKEFYYIQGEKEPEKRCRTFLLDLCLQAALHQPHNILQTVEKVITFTEYGDYYYYYDILSDFLLDLYSRVKQYESETGRRVLPALLPVYQSGPAVWSINLSERKVSLLLEVLKLQTEKKPVVLRDCSDEESEVRSFLQCLPYISHLSFKEFDSKQGEKEPEKRCRTFLLDLCLQAALHQPHNILQTVQKVITFTEYGDYYYYYDILSDFLLDLYSRVKQYESETGRRVLPALLPVYQSVPAVWSINLSERKVSLLLEVLKLQTEKKPVDLRHCSDEESEVRSFLQCLPYISHLMFNKFDSKQGEKEPEKRYRTFLLDLCLQAALHQPQNILQTVEKVITFTEYRDYYYYYDILSDFLLDLYSRVKQYESETGRRVLPALLPVYQSVPTVWSINLSERKVSLLLEVLKLQTKKKPVVLRDCSDEESEVRSFLQCLPYISHLRFDSKQGEKEPEKRYRTFLLDLCLQAALHQPQNILQTVEKVITFTEYRDYYYYYDILSDFLLDLYSRVKQYESETGRRVLPALLPVYQSGPTVWSINLSKRKVSLLLEVLKLQTEKKPVDLRDCSDEESEVRSFLQCLPYISHLRFKQFYSDSESTASIQLLLNLSIAAVDCKSDKGESFTELLASVCSYNTFPFGEECHGLQERQSDFLLDLYSRVKQYESETGRRVLPALLPVYQSGPAVWSINLSERKVSLLLEVLKLQKKKKPVDLRHCSDEESEVRSFLQCLPYISHLSFNVFYSDSESTASIQLLLNLSIAAVDCKSDKGESFTELLASVCSYNTFPFDEECHGLQEEQSDFLLDLYSRVKQYESETGRRVLPALLPVYQSGPAVWSINLSERKVSLLLEVLKLQTEKKPVELRDCSDEESEVRSFLQCLPYISHLRFKRFDSDSESTASIQLLLNLSIAAVDCKSDKGESFTELLASVCSYNTFPFGEEFHGFQEEQSDFLLDLYSRVKQYESETGRRVLPALLPVYQSGPAVWYINLSERKVSLLLELLKLQTEKKPVELRDCSDEESEVRSFLQCLPYISHLRFKQCEEEFIPRLSKAVVDCAEDTKLVRAFFAAMDFIFVIDWVLTTRECRAVRKVLRLSDSKVKLTLKPRAISLRGARFLFRHITHLQKLCLSDRVVGRMVRAFGAVRAGGSLVIEELCLRLNSINPKKEIFTFLSSLSSLLNIWTVHCVNLTECRMEAHSLISLMCHPGNLKIRLSKETLQQFTSLLCEVQDGELTRFFLEKVGGDLTSCSLSWEELIYFLQQRVCCISANIRKSKITYNHARQILPLLSEIQFKRLNPSVVLSIIREIYETGSAHCVSSLLSSTHSCINLNNTELDSYHCTALCFTLQHCTSVSLSLLWTSIPEGELVKILPLFNRVSQLSVDRVLLLKLIHCCSISEIQQGAVAAVFSALQSRLDFSCSTGLDLTTETQDNTLHLTTEDCRDISTAIQKSLQHTELILVHCEMEDTGVDMLFLILHSVKLCCSKPLLLRFLARLHVVNESDCVRHAMSLSQALDEEMDLSETPLDLNACRSLALFLEFSEGLSELDLSHCQLTDHSLELLFPHLHKAAVLEFVLFLSLSHNDIGDGLAGRIYTVVSTNRNIQTVRLHNNRITDIEPFRKDKRFEIW
ncbi:uncharacterized protein LOC108272973 isoform X2 [Ictalurus punctatus]|uniref:Uncharacterized protein LOC108272973 isoform X2 n=1 Tax=Ictalurus punctatus TaxID=7998 RepID=A0A9F7TP50_ICTPU|nr:uncharacterized protein LOC108272973 isoform X2 [Ictalurus punctatus]